MTSVGLGMSLNIIDPEENRLAALCQIVHTIDDRLQLIEDLTRDGFFHATSDLLNVHLLINIQDEVFSLIGVNSLVVVIGWAVDMDHKEENE